MDLNKAMIIGNVTRDPEVRTTPTGQSVVSFGVATNLVWKDQMGNKQEKVEFHNIVAWRKLAETIGKYVKKGSKLYVEGRLQTRTWDDKNGVKRYTTEIVADNIIMLDRAGARPASNEGAQPSPADNYSQAAPAAAAVEEEINVEDIPF
ncbi:MAG: single-stranded DNA-binding protein [Candidatus Komeilibacteria bacterium]|nr:single-stranded DNA-binding protein [Candidatus Komeilibacteria bacterium]